MEDKPHYLNHRARLRERYLQGGRTALHDYEVVEMLLGYAIPRKDIKPLAKTLLARFGSIKGIIDADISEIKSVKGMGETSAVIFKLIRDILLYHLRETITKTPQLNCTNDMLNYWKVHFGGLKEEHFCVICLNTQNEVVGMETITRGTIDGVFIHPRRVIEKVLTESASAIIIVHNHPSGDVSPSEDDIKMTKTIQQICLSLEIAFHDHLIIGKNSHYSFRHNGII
ncbi:MAG: DNA repair protein RadC [Deltaproteobacteria bacterium]